MQVNRVQWGKVGMVFGGFIGVSVCCYLFPQHVNTCWEGCMTLFEKTRGYSKKKPSGLIFLTCFLPHAIMGLLGSKLGHQIGSSLDKRNFVWLNGKVKPE